MLEMLCISNKTMLLYNCIVNNRNICEDIVHGFFNTQFGFTESLDHEAACVAKNKHLHVKIWDLLLFVGLLDIVKGISIKYKFQFETFT